MRDVTREILIDARELVARGWTQGASARNAAGEICGVLSPQATQFCASGACFKVAFDRDFDATEAAGAVVELGRRGRSVFSWQDRPGRTQEEVLTRFDETLEAS